MSSRTPLWLDCDTGHDDAYALLLSAHDPRIELLGVSTVHGNAALDQTTFNTRAVLEALGRRDVAVYSGAAKPLVRDAVHAADIHGESGLGGVTLLPPPVAPAATDVDHLAAMHRALAATAPDTAWLVSTGTLTNAALLFQRFPDLAGHIKGLSIMGGAVGGGFTDAPMGKVKGEREGERFGNWTAYAEFNIYCDPEAARFIFAQPRLRAKTTLIPLDLSHQVLGTRAVRRALLYGDSPDNAPRDSTETPRDPTDKTPRDPSETPRDPSETPRDPTDKTPRDPTDNAPRDPSALRALFAQTMSFFAGTYADVFSITAGPPLHDPLAVAAAVYAELFSDSDGERFRVDVVTDGVHSPVPSEVGQLGRTRVAVLAPGEGGCRIPRRVDVDAFWRLTEDALQRADAVSPMPHMSRGELEKHGVFVGID